MTRLLLPAALLSTLVAHAYEPERATNNLAHEVAECAAYFLLISAVPSQEQATVQGLRAKSAALAELSVGLSSMDLTKSRVSFASETMRREMKYDWSNLSLILQKYNYPCIDVAKDPKARMQYWLKKRD